MPNSYVFEAFVEDSATFSSVRYFEDASYFVQKVFESNKIYREYVYSVAVYQKYLTRLGESIIFEPWRENYYFSQPSTYVRILFIFQSLNLMSYF